MHWFLDWFLFKNNGSHFFWIKYLLCDSTFKDIDVLKSHYQFYHFINQNNYFYRELFSPDNISKRCDECKIESKSCRLKKNHNFLFHYNQVGGSRSQPLPINVLKRGPVIYTSINFNQHKEFYNFYEEKIADTFLNSVYERFVPDKNFMIQRYVELINYKQTEIVNLENTRVWQTNVFKGCHFNPYIRREIKKRDSEENHS